MPDTMARRGKATSNTATNSQRQPNLEYPMRKNVQREHHDNTSTPGENGDRAGAAGTDKDM